MGAPGGPSPAILSATWMNMINMMMINQIA